MFVYVADLLGARMLGTVSELDLRLIRVFLAVVEAGGISAAQTALNTTQPTISAQLATLEGRSALPATDIKLFSWFRLSFRLAICTRTELNCVFHLNIFMENSQSFWALID